MTTKIGVGTSEIDWDVLENKVGAGFEFDCRRSYDDYIPTSFARCAAAEDVGKQISIYSCKPGKYSEYTRICDGVEAILDGVPDTHDFRLTVQHEPEDNTSGGSGKKETILGNWTEFKTMQRKLRVVVDRVNEGRTEHIKFGGTLMAWSAGNGNAALAFPGADVWQSIAWDGYCWYQQNRRSAESIFGLCSDFCNSKGVNFAVSETGIGKDHYDRPKWIRDSINWVNKPSVNATWWCYWNNSNNFLTTNAEYQALGHTPV